jgi:hypothetical protein
MHFGNYMYMYMYFGNYMYMYMYVHWDLPVKKVDERRVGAVAPGAVGEAPGVDLMNQFRL